MVRIPACDSPEGRRPTEEDLINSAFTVVG